MPYIRQRLTIFTISAVAVVTAGLVGSSPASALDVKTRFCTNGSANVEVGGTQVQVARGAQDDCVRFGVTL
ncbi:hypothetical protein ABT063_01760 [Streptomyces sp. NPDC002838]|uniref:hypothetical protein n=1 Tax=Streptomyces sp. NPDC002838 TaxID=3154436 RepID=UPI003319A404